MPKDRFQALAVHYGMTELIAEVVKEITGAQQILLFGSRVNGNVRSDSDYDVLVVLKDNVGQKERLSLSSRCRRRLATAGVDADVLVKSPEDIHEYGDKRGSIVHEALRTGVPL